MMFFSYALNPFHEQSLFNLTNHVYLLESCAMFLLRDSVTLFLSLLFCAHLLVTARMNSKTLVNLLDLETTAQGVCNYYLTI